jgi:hypothetical protein
LWGAAACDEEADFDLCAVAAKVASHKTELMAKADSKPANTRYVIFAPLSTSHNVPRGHIRLSVSAADVNSFRSSGASPAILPKSSPVAGLRLVQRIIGALKSYPIVGAILIVVALNVTLLKFDPLRGLNPDSLPAAKTWVWWAAQDYKNRQPAPDIALLGCSIVMHSIWFAEATHRNQPVELIVDHECKALSDKVAKLVPGVHPQAFNFGLPGAMPSDDTMIVRALFNGEHKPKVVVLGLAPRDTFDNTFHTPAGTKHYQYLSRFTEVNEPEDLLVPQVWERPKFWVQRAIYLKDKAKAIQNVASAEIRSVGSPVLSRFPKSPLDSTAKDDDKTYALFKDELERGFWIAQPNAPYRYADVAWDAQRKIGRPNNEMFKIQTQWIEKFMEACKERDIDVVLVNLPVSGVARGIMGEPLYQRHLALLQELSEKWKCPLIDSNTTAQYDPSDWTDWAHMRDRGGMKILDAMAQAIASDQKVVAHLRTPENASRQIAGASASPAGN